MITDPVLLAATKIKLKEARDSYHDLISGTMPRVVVDQNGERVEFTSTNKAALYAYILELQALIGCGPATLAPLRPAQFTF